MKGWLTAKKDEHFETKCRDICDTYQHALAREALGIKKTAQGQVLQNHIIKRINIKKLNPIKCNVIIQDLTPFSPRRQVAERIKENT